MEMEAVTRRPDAGASRLLAPREEVRTALLEAVGALIQRLGYRKTSVEDIAQEAGVSRATAYLYFPNKEALVMAWIERSDQRHLEQLKSLAQEKGTVRERVAAFLLARVMIRFDSAQAYTKSIDEMIAALRSRSLEQRSLHHEQQAIVIAELLREGVQSGEWKALPDPLAVARLLVLRTNSLLPYSLTPRQLGERESVEAQARGLIELMLGGLPVPGASD